ncbi:MAG: lyase family protein [Anaerolineae bacterium]
MYDRVADFTVLSVLAGVAATAAQLAFNIRLLQSPPFGEWSEGFAAGQVGSSAMPWKRNPINAENVDSLARQLAVLPQVAWQNAAACAARAHAGRLGEPPHDPARCVPPGRRDPGAHAAPRAAPQRGPGERRCEPPAVRRSWPPSAS